jgi:carbamoylphosphate synthase large subunit
MTPSFLIVGSSHSDFYIAKAIKDLGYTLYTTGSYIEGICNCLADRYYYSDYSQFDQVSEVVDRLSPDFVIPSANDYSYLTTCRINDRLGSVNLDNYKTAKSLHLKNSFRRICSDAHIRSPRHWVLTRERSGDIADITYPCIVKPTDLTGGKGICIISSHEQLRSSIDWSLSKSKENVCVVEEYIPGNLYSLSGFCIGGLITNIYCDREYLGHSSFGVVASHSGISTEERNTLMTLIPMLQDLVRDFGLVDGLLHVQIIISSIDGKPYVVELTRRMPGDLYSIPVEITTGYNHAMMFLSILTGMQEFMEYDLCSLIGPCLLTQEQYKICDRYQYYGSKLPNCSLAQHSPKYNETILFSIGNRFGKQYRGDADIKGVFFGLTR